ncbi:MAG: YihY/virulence factor BrkB family protein [Actinomycetota bacterium]|nr:YihY/virulence factor BrkB family protein [Actinomycetota bacterium]
MAFAADKAATAATAAASPLQLPKRDWKQAAKSTKAEIKQDRVGIISAGVAYYWFLAVFPGLIALVGLLDLLNLGRGAFGTIEQAIRSALPGDAAAVLVDALRDTGQQREGASAIAAIVGIALALWSASAGMVALQTGLDVAYDIEGERKFVRKRLYALMMIVAGGVLGGGAAVLLIAGAPIGAWIDNRVGGSGVLIVVWTAVRWVLALGLLTVLIAMFYFLGPNRESPRWTWVTPGGVVATLIWVAASLVFSFYVSNFGPYAKTYGSLAGVVVLVLWLFLTALAVLVGAELNAELETQGRERGGVR